MLGLMLVAGGKYTTYRVMAADVVDRAARRLGRRTARRAPTELPLLGADGYAAMWRRPGRPGPPARRLGRRGRAPAGAVRHADPGAAGADRRRPDCSAAPLAGAPEYLAAEVAYAARAEGALHLEDVLTRRTRISFETTHRGARVGRARGRADGRGARLGRGHAGTGEIEHYRARVEAERESQRMPDDPTADAARLGAPDVRGFAADRGVDGVEGGHVELPTSTR